MNKILRFKFYFLFVWHLDKVDIVNYLIDNGANINAKTSNGQTPLHLSVAGGFYKYKNLDKTDVVKLLLKKGATVNEQDNNGDTALHLCSVDGMFSNWSTGYDREWKMNWFKFLCFQGMKSLFNFLYPLELTRIWRIRMVLHQVILPKRKVIPHFWDSRKSLKNIYNVFYRSFGCDDHVECFNDKNCWINIAIT